MKMIQTSVVLIAMLSSAVSQAQNTQWQVQIGTVEPAPQAAPQPAPQAQPVPVQPTRPGILVPQIFTPPPPPPVPVAQATDIVQSIQSQQEQRIRWAAQRGYVTEPDYRRLQQIQANIEHNRRIAYVDGYFNVPEQQFVFGQLNVMSAEIDTLMLGGNYALAYFQQFSSPIPVWTVNAGWVNGRYELKADAHHSRAYRPAAQPPSVQQTQQPVPHGHPRHRNHLRDLLDGVFR